MHSPHWIDLFSSFPPNLTIYFFAHLIKEAEVGSEVVGADEENILSWSSDQKWEIAVGKKQSKSPTS